MNPNLVAIFGVGVLIVVVAFLPPVRLPRVTSPLAVSVVAVASVVALFAIWTVGVVVYESVIVLPDCDPTSPDYRGIGICGEL